MGIVYTQKYEEYTLFSYNHGRIHHRDYLTVFPNLKIGMIYSNDSDIPSHCFYFQDNWLDLLRKVKSIDHTKIISPLICGEIKSGDLGLFQGVNFRRWFCKGAEPLRNEIHKHILEIYEPLDTFIREEKKHGQILQW